MSEIVPAPAQKFPPVDKSEQEISIHAWLHVWTYMIGVCELFYLLQSGWRRLPVGSKGRRHE